MSTVGFDPTYLQVMSLTRFLFRHIDFIQITRLLSYMIVNSPGSRFRSYDLSVMSR